MAKTKNPDRELAVTGVRIMVPGQRARRHGSRTNPPTELELVAAFDGEPTAKQWKRIEPMFWWAIRELKAGPLLVRIAVQAEGKFRARLRVLLNRADLGTCTRADITLAYS